MSPTAIAKAQVLAKHPSARLLKSSIASWGVGVGPSLWLSYGQARSYLAWRVAARNISVDSSAKAP